MSKWYDNLQSISHDAKKKSDETDDICWVQLANRISKDINNPNSSISKKILRTASNNEDHIYTHYYRRCNAKNYSSISKAERLIKEQTSNNIDVSIFDCGDYSLLEDHNPFLTCVEFSWRKQ